MVKWVSKLRMRMRLVQFMRTAGRARLGATKADRERAARARIGLHAFAGIGNKVAERESNSILAML